MDRTEVTYTGSAASSVSPDAYNQDTSPAADEQSNTAPKRRASRAGTRCVSTLTEAQLSRKRANDREAQRAIRQRNKSHIEGLERRIEELSAANVDAATLYEVRQRNLALEDEVRQLKEVLAETRQATATRLEWNPAAGFDESSMLMAYDGSHEVVPIMGFHDPSRRTTASFSGSSTSSLLGGIVEDVNQYDPITHTDRKEFLMHDDATIHRNWVGTPAQSHASSFIDTNAQYLRQIPVYQQAVNAPPGMPSSFVNQPSLCSYELPIRYLPPSDIIDHILLRTFQDQRRQGAERNSGLKLLEPPNMSPLLPTSEPNLASAAEPVSNALATLIFSTPVQALPEKVACLYIMHKLLSWQITPGLNTYQEIPAWYSPLPTQLVDAHEIWVSYIIWPRLREKIIKNQALYMNGEFITHYCLSLNVNWPYRDTDVLMLVDGALRVTPAFEHHLCNLENWSLNMPFAQRYPELQESCKFTGFPPKLNDHIGQQQQT